MSVYRHPGHERAGSVAGDDRRSVCRYSVVQHHAWLGWWEGETFRSISGEIVDISLRGAMLVVEALPPTAQSVWFCPPGGSASAPSEWLEAKVIEARKRLLGPRRVRIVFRQPFPYEVFKAVVYGPDAVGGLRPKLWIPESVSESADLW